MARGVKTGGRTKGTPNKVSAELKDMIAAALALAGGVDYLNEQALKNPGAFLALLGKTLPKDITAHADGNLTITVTTGVPVSD